MKTRVLTIIVLLNATVSIFVTYAVLVFTSRMAIETDLSHSQVLYTQECGGPQRWYRYGAVVLASLLLHGILAVFNISIVPYIEADHARALRICAYIAVGCIALMMAQTIVMLALGLPRSTL